MVFVPSKDNNNSDVGKGLAIFQDAAARDKWIGEVFDADVFDDRKHLLKVST